MADTIIQRNPADFGLSSLRWDGVGSRVRVRDDDGDHDAWELQDGSIVGKALRFPSSAKLAAMVAKEATAQAARDKDAVARAAVKAEVQRILGKTAGTRTVSEKGYLGLAWLVFREEG
jgi:hypothetical protein